MLYDVDQTALYRGLDTIRTNFAREVAKEKLTQEQADEARSRITLTTKIEDLAPASIAIEAATERFEIKAECFAILIGCWGRRRFLRRIPVRSRSRRSPR